MTLAETLRTSSTEKDAWHIDHQGPLVDVKGYIWWCGDNWCNCTQAKIVARFRNLADSRWIVPRLLWAGPFHTDGEPGALDELLTKRQRLRETEPDLEALIVWDVAT